MRKRKASDGSSDRQLDRFVEKATVDAHDEEEQASGFFHTVFTTAHAFGVSEFGRAPRSKVGHQSPGTPAVPLIH